MGWCTAVGAAVVASEKVLVVRAGRSGVQGQRCRRRGVWEKAFSEGWIALLRLLLRGLHFQSFHIGVARRSPSFSLVRCSEDAHILLQLPVALLAADV